MQTAGSGGFGVMLEERDKVGGLEGSGGDCASEDIIKLGEVGVEADVGVGGVEEGGGCGRRNILMPNQRRCVN